jgi:spermidine synthase
MRRALLLIFFLTGATALGYQLLWARMLANTLGHEMPAVLAVVSTFMGGMALGAWSLGGLIQRSARPGRWYAALEIFIGLWAALIVPSHPLLLLPAVMAMGASFPAMHRFMQGRCIGALYAANTLGAFAGILIVTWWLMPAIGLRLSAVILGVVNVIVGLLAWALAVGVRVLACPDVLGGGDKLKLEHQLLTRPRLFGTACTTGFLAIAFEIAGVRVLAQVIENTVYSFAAVVAVYLLGTSLGAAWYQRFGYRRPQLLNDLFGCVAVTCVGAVMVMSKAQAIYNSLRHTFGDSQLAVLFAEMMLATAVLLLPTIFMGALFSLLMEHCAERFSKILAMNTFGSALAPFVAGVLLLPAIGSKWTLVAISLAYFTLVTQWRWLMPIVAAGIVILLPPLQFVEVPAGEALVDYREGVMASVAVVRSAAGDRTLKVNNRFQMGGTSAAATEHRQAHLPLLLHPKPSRALFLGTGTGITFGAASLYPELEADGVELVPEIVDVMHHFKPQNFMDKYAQRLRMHVADARRFVKTTTNSYDVIVADLFHPARDGAGTLYTKEHFAAIRGRLNAGGIFCQWLPLHQMDEQMLRVVIRTFLDVFPNTRAYLLHWSVDVPVLGLIASHHWPPHAERTANDPKLSGGYVAGPDALRRFAGNAAINTDDHQIITYAAPRFSYKRNPTSYGRLLTILPIEDPPTDFLKARNVYLQGLVHETEGRVTQALEYYIQSARISNDFTMGYSRCITIAAAQAKDRPDAARSLLERLIAAQPHQIVAQDLLQRLFSP